MKCYNCGNNLPDGAKYCIVCGQKIGEKGNASSTHFEGAKEHLDPNKKRKGTRITFPPVWQWIISIALILMIAIVFFHTK